MLRCCAGLVNGPHCSLFALLVCNLLGFTVCLFAVRARSRPASPARLLAWTSCLLCFACLDSELHYLLACFTSLLASRLCLSGLRAPARRGGEGVRRTGEGQKEASRPGAQDQEGAPAAVLRSPASGRETARDEWASGGCSWERRRCVVAGWRLEAASQTATLRDR